MSVGLYMVYCVLDTLPLQYNKLLALLFQIYISETKTKGEKMLLVFFPTTDTESAEMWEELEFIDYECGDPQSIKLQNQQ